MCRFKPASLCSADGRTQLEILGKKVVAFCGIARPSAFVDSIKQIGAEVVSLEAYPDHHWFSESELEGAHTKMKELNADFIVTTQKDIVRLDIPAPLKDKVLALVMEIEWIGAPPAFNLPEVQDKSR